MCDRPAWLPDLFVGDPLVREVYDRLYNEVFCRDFKSTQILYQGHAVWYFPDKAHDREFIFVHFTSRKINEESDARELRPERCARLPWARPMIEHAGDPSVLAWDYEEGNGNIHTYVWLHEHDYLVLMKRMPDESRRLLSAYCIDHRHERQKLRKKYERRITA